MKNLNFGCRRSDFLVSNIKDDWFVQCRFYEPDREKHFTFRRRLNRFKSDKDKAKAAKAIISVMTSLLDDKDYNPRTKQYMFQEGEINPYLSVGEALRKTLAKKEFTPEHRVNVESDLNKFLKAFEKLDLNYLKIKDVELIHVKKALESLNMTNYGYNKGKIHLSSLFTDLVDAGALKVNPCTGIKSKRHIVQEKEIFTDEELWIIADHIKANYPHFYNFFQIFFLSGCRVPEMLGLKRSDMNLEKSEFKITLKKGELYEREKRAIIPDAIPFWKDQLETAIFDDDFIFSFFYQPGPDEMHRSYIYKFWKAKVMTPTGINKTIYALKHTFLDKVEDAQYSAQIAAGHRNDRTTAIYTVGREKRRLEAQKKISISAFG